LAAEPPAQYSPALQATHACAEDVVPDALCTVPARHAPPARHADWFTSVVDRPAGQTEQLRSVVADGGLDTNEPTGQLRHATQLVALAVLLDVPLGQAAQI
jgi:hypothetical protein